MQINKDTAWQNTDTQVFWGEIAPTEHMVQIYENDEVFLDLLDGFVSSGIKTGECVIIIATNDHLKFLGNKLKEDGHDLEVLYANDQLITLDAEETLNKFMVDGWPDEARFYETVSSLIYRGHKKQRKVRAFGEMVALLWAQGHSGATVMLENLWSRFCESEVFCLFCAYPRSGFTQNINFSMDDICCSHSKMISGEHTSKTEIFYKQVQQKAS